MEGKVPRAHAFADVGRIMFDVRHRFDAARNDDIGHARLNHHRGVDDRLQPRTAATVELVAGHLDRQSRGKP